MIGIIEWDNLDSKRVSHGGHRSEVVLVSQDGSGLIDIGISW